MLTVRHSSASGPLAEGWDFRRRTRRIEASVRQGAAVVALSFVVCSPDRPVFGAHPIRRLDGESWLVLPARYERTWPGGVETLTATPCPVGDVLAPGEQLALSNASDDVCKELDAL